MLTSAEQIILDITVVLFSISYAWMVGERINNFPKIRRFSSICDFIFSSESNETKKKLNKDSFIILIVSWGLLWAGLALSIRLLIRFSNSLEASTPQIEANEIYLIPFLFLLAPQFISRLISSIVLAVCDAEVQDLIENNKEVFSCYANSWKTKFGLETGSTRTSDFKNKAWMRAASSFFYGSITYGLIIFNT
jgi:hypothetical protein